MRSLLTGLLSALMLFPLMVQADDYYTQKKCSAFEGGAELLLLRPTTCDLLYAIIDPRTSAEVIAQGATGATDFQAVQQSFPQGTKKSIRADYTPGLRVWLGGVSLTRCADVTLTYERLHTRDVRRAAPQDGGGLWITFASPTNIQLILYDPIDAATVAGQLPATVRARADFDWDSVAIEVGIRRMFGCHLWTRGYAQLQYFSLYHKFEVSYTGTALPGNNTDPAAQSYRVLSRRGTNTWMVGPEVGSEAIYTLACGLGVGGKMGLGIGAGSVNDGRFEDIDVNNLAGASTGNAVDQELDIQSRPDFRGLPWMHARIGFSYICCTGCGTFVAQAGYEWRTYFQAIDRQLFGGLNDEPLLSAGATGRNRCDSFSLDGFYFSVMAQI